MVFILNLNDIKKDILKLNKKDSCALYNKSIDNINNNYISSGLKFLKEARDLRPDDVDVLNLIGLVNLLKCNFDESVESFYKSLICEKTALCEKYINMLTSEEFLIFFERYNQFIRMINKGMYKEAIQGFKLITEQYSDLIEPYELLALLYEKEEEYIKFDECLEVLKTIDKENYLLNQENDTLDIYSNTNRQVKINANLDDYKNKPVYKNIDGTKNMNEEGSKDKKQKTSDSNKKKSIRKNKYIYIAIILGVLLIGQNIYSSYKMNNLTNKISKNSGTKDRGSIDSSLNKKENNREENEVADKTSDTNKSAKNINKNDVKSQENTVENESNSDSNLFTEDELMSKANTLKSEKQTKSSIQLYKKVADIGENKGNTSEATYQVAILSEKLKDYDTAEEYYKMYVENYSEKDSYFDESYYNLGMMYYNKGDLKNSKLTLKKLVNKVPNSMYNNSKVKEILKEE